MPGVYSVDACDPTELDRRAGAWLAESPVLTTSSARCWPGRWPTRHLRRRRLVGAARHGGVAGVVRAGPVYAPPERRGRGDATSCVAAISQKAFDGGAYACMLYTDANNPTSNGIYQRIGYRVVAEAAHHHFHPLGTGQLAPSNDHD